MEGTPPLSLQKTHQNKKMKRSFQALLLLALIMGAVSCGGKKEKASDKVIVPSDPRTDFEMSRTAADSTTLLKLAKQYLDELKNGNVEGALDLLYEVKNHEAQPLSEARKNEIRKSVMAFPVNDYTIKSMLLYNDSETQVRYTITLFEKPQGDNRPNTVEATLNPVRIDSVWYLTVGNRTVETNYRNN